MKRGKVLMTVLVVLAVLFASCASHLGEDENAAASKAVKINFAMIVDDESAQKAVALHGGVNDFKFFYMATPQWESDNPIQGDTDEKFVEISSNQAHMTDSEHKVAIGYFTPGLWKFDVVVTSSDGTPATALDGTKVIYKASDDWKNATYSLFDNTGNRTVGLPAVPMELYTAGTQATLTIKVAVPKIKLDAAPDVTLEISDGGSATAERSLTVTIPGDPPVPGVPAAPNTKTGTAWNAPLITDATANNWYYFTKTFASFIPGKYTINLKYYDKEFGNGGVKVGGATIVTTILPTDYTIWGTIENGEFQIATMTLTGLGFTLDYTINGNTVTSETSVAMGGTMVCTPDPLKNDPDPGSYTMKWYVNNKEQNVGVNSTTGVFTFDTDSTTSTANPGTYEIVCAATNNIGSTATTYKSYTVTVTPPAAISVTAPSSTVAKDGSLLFTAGETPANSTLQWYVKKDGVEVLQTGATTNTFTFNTSSTTYTTATPGEYEIILKATGDAGIGGGQTGYGSKFVTVLAP